MATFKQYTASGGASENFSIKSFTSAEIKVRVEGVLQNPGTHYNITNYTTNGGTVTWTSGNVPGSGTVRIYRITATDSPQGATFSAGSAIKASDLNDNHTQVLRGVEEENDQLIQTWDLEDGLITSAKIKDGAVIRTKIGADAIDGTKIDDNAIDSDHYVDGSIDGIHIASDELDSRHYKDGSIDLEHLAPNSVDTSKIVNGTIVDADISGTAEIAVSKLADGVSRQLLQTDHAGTGVEWTSNVKVPGTFQGVGAGQFDSTLTVGGTSTLATVDINAGAIDGTTVGASSPSTGSFTTLTASGTTTAAAINASGAVGVDGNFDVATNKFTVAASSGNTVIAGDLEVGGTFDVTGTSNYTGQQTVPGGALVKNIRVGLDAANEVSTSSGNLVLDSAGGTVQVTDNFNATGNADVDGNLNVDGTLTVDGVSTLTGAVTATGGVVGDVTGDVTGNADTATTATNVTIATNSTEAANHWITFVDGTPGSTTTQGLEIDTDLKYTPSSNTLTANITGNVSGTAGDLAAGAKVTNSEQGSHTANDTTYYTTAASDARYYNIGSLEEIQSGETWAAADNKIATTAAIDARIVDLVDDVGGFVPIANETSFPNANPDVNNGAGTLVSVKALASNLVSNGSGVATISNGTVGNSTVTINGLANSTTYPAGRGMLVETTSTLNTYTFHRQLPEATATSTVANNIANVNTCATNIANINTVAADATDIGVVAGKETEIGRLGTADAVADMNTLATTAIVADLETCADNNSNISTVGGAISNVNTVAGAIANVNTTATNIANVNTTATNITNVNTTATNIANVNTVGSNIGTVNDFAARYRGPQNNAGEYTTSLDVGDLYFNTTIGALKVYTGATDGWVAGVTQTGDYALKTGSTYTGSNTHNDGVKSIYGTSNDGLEIHHSSNHSYIEDTGTGSLYIDSNQLYLRNNDTSNVLLYTTSAGVVKINHNGTTKFETTSAGAQITGQMGSTTIHVPDGSTGIQVGNSNDLKIYHTSDQSHILNNTGQFILRGDILKLKNKDNDEMYIECTDNSSVDLYYDNGLKFKTTSSGVMVVGGEGAEGNLEIYADEGDDNADKWRIRAETGGGLKVQNMASGAWERNIKCDGNGGVELYYDDSLKFNTNSGGVKVHGDIYADDSDKILLGSDTDLRISHTGSHAELDNYTGNLSIRQLGSSGDIYLDPKSGERGVKVIRDGGVELYHNNAKKLETTSAGVDITGQMGSDTIHVPDGSTGIQVGNSNDLKIYHDGTKNIIKSTNGNIEIDNNSEYMARFLTNGAVELYYDNSKKFETTSSGINVTNQITNTSGNDFVINSTGRLRLDVANGEKAVYCDNNGAVELYYNNGKRLNTTANGIQMNGDINLGDGNRVKIGAGEDLEIYHSGGTSYIRNGGANSGNLMISAGNSGCHVYIQGKDGEDSIIAERDGAVKLYYDNSLKCQTSSTGITVTGNVDITGSYSIDDGEKYVAGNGSDLQIYHDGNNTSYIKDITANLNIEVPGGSNVVRIKQTSGGETMAQFIASGACELYYNNVKHLATGSEGIYVYGASGGDGTLRLFADQGNANADAWKFTASQAASELYISNYSQGSWHSNIKCVGHGGVELYYQNAINFQTTSTGNNIPGNKDLRFSSGGWSGDSCKIQNHGNWLYIQGGSNGHIFRRNNGSDAWYISSGGHMYPGADNTYDLGTTGNRIRNVYTYDLHLNNEGSQNDVDGTWGSWTIQEGQDDLFLLNKRNGKKYKFNLTEVS